MCGKFASAAKLRRSFQPLADLATGQQEYTPSAIIRVASRSSFIRLLSSTATAFDSRRVCAASAAGRADSDVVPPSPEATVRDEQAELAVLGGRLEIYAGDTYYCFIKMEFNLVSDGTVRL